MEPIIYEGRKITPIMKPMLVWDDNEKNAVERFVYVKEDESSTSYLWRVAGCGGAEGSGWKHAKPLPIQPTVEITVKINGKECTLKDISEETLLKIRNSIE